MHNITGKTYKCISTAILNVRDDEYLVYALTLDALYKWINSYESVEMLNNFVVNNPTISKEKLCGITLALIEFQRKNYIPDKLLNELRILVDKRIFDDNSGTELRWVKNVIILNRKTFTATKFQWILSQFTIKEKFISPIYIDIFLDLLKHITLTNSSSKEINYYMQEAINDILFLLKKRNIYPDYIKVAWHEMLKILLSKQPFALKFKYLNDYYLIPINKWFFNVSNNRSIYLGMVTVLAVFSGCLGFIVGGPIGGVIFPVIACVIWFPLIHKYKLKETYLSSD